MVNQLEALFARTVHGYRVRFRRNSLPEEIKEIIDGQIIPNTNFPNYASVLNTALIVCKKTRLPIKPEYSHSSDLWVPGFFYPLEQKEQELTDYVLSLEAEHLKLQQESSTVVGLLKKIQAIDPNDT